MLASKPSSGEGRRRYPRHLPTSGRSDLYINYIRPHDKGPDGMKRWVGLGVIADNLINIGRAMAARPR